MGVTVATRVGPVCKVGWGMVGTWVRNESVRCEVGSLGAWGGNGLVVAWAEWQGSNNGYQVRCL